LLQIDSVRCLKIKLEQCGIKYQQMMQIHGYIKLIIWVKNLLYAREILQMA